MGAGDLAYEALKSKILAQEYLPGIQLKEMQISKELGLTRTPVREAIIRLEREGLVKTVYNRGAFVTVFSRREIEDLLDVREALEIKALNLAIRRANRDELDSIEKALRQRELLIKNHIIKVDFRDPELDFHLAIIKLSKNQRLISTWQTMQSQLSLVRVTSTMRNRRYLKALEEHKQILALVRNGDVRRAEKLLIKHIAYAKSNMLSSLSDVIEDQPEVKSHGGGKT
ncbi:MAG: GntR family transcriptional regulator [Proteobacteria bacterium]|nr:GntR family transcriptional regulator [Pseudomonadota bacterium]MBU2227591.1 GntR family transcriptional regulator [Pseudomonadota bacterium]